MDPLQSLGMPLTLAVFRLAPDSQKEYAQDFERRFLRSETSPTDTTWVVFYTGLLQQLHDGNYEAVGTRHGQTRAEVIPVHFMVDARPDFDAGTIEHAGVVYHGVRIRAVYMRTSSAAKRQIVDQSMVDAWMGANTRVGSKRLQSLQDCMRATGCTDAQARKAWTQLPDEIKGTRGLRKG